jgi:hypothetical protein
LLLLVLRHVRIFEWNNEVWNQVGSHIYGEAAESVALLSDGSTVACATSWRDSKETDDGLHPGHARIFEWNNEEWKQMGNFIDGENANDRSGFLIAISSNGSTVAIGSKHNDGNGSIAGHVRIFEWNNGAWNQLGSDIDGEAENDQSGYSVALLSDGSTVAIGAPNNNGNGNGDDSGHVRVYNLDVSQ